MDPRQLLAEPAPDPVRERVWLAAARRGDRGARDLVVRANLRLVALRARSLGFDGHRLDDAVQDGAEGLIRAVDRFDPAAGASLATFAWPWITGAILAGARRQSLRPVASEAMVEAPDVARVDVQAALAELPAAQAEVVRLRFGLDGPAGVPLTRREVAARVDLSESAVRRLEHRAVRHLRDRLATVGDRAPR